MLLEALVACAGVTLKAVATAIDVPLKSGTVSAEGDLDFRGTLGVAKDAPVGFAQIRLRFEVDTDAPQEKLDQLLKLTERYCVVYQTIQSGPPVALSLQRTDGRMTEIVGLDHLQLAMPRGREADARAFYAGILGLAELQKPPNLAARGGVWFALGSQQLHLGVEPDFRPAKKAHPAFLVRDVAGLRARLEREGFAPYDDEPLAGYQRFYVADPFGNRLEFLQPVKRRTSISAVIVREGG